MTRMNNGSDAAHRQQADAAAFIQSQRPQHTQTTLEMQRERINNWVKRWYTDRHYRQRVLDKARREEMMR